MARKKLYSLTILNLKKRFCVYSIQVFRNYWSIYCPVLKWIINDPLTFSQCQSKWLGSVFKLWSYWFVYANNSFNWWNFIYHKYIQTFSCTFSGLDIRTVIQTFGTNTQQSCSLQSDTPHHVFSSCLCSAGSYGTSTCRTAVWLP